MIIRVRVKERIIATPGYVIGQGSGPRPWVVTCGGGSGGGGNSLQTPFPFCPFYFRKRIGAGMSKFRNWCV